MTTENRVETPEVVQLVESYAADEHRDARRYDNKDVLDDSGIFTLHRLAARIYALGYQAGEAAQSERDNGRRRRKLDAETDA